MALAVPLAERVGWKGVECVSEAALRMSGDHLPAYIGLMQISTGLLDRLLAQTDSHTALDVFRLAADIAERHPAPAVRFLQNSPDLFMLMGKDGAFSVAAVIDRTLSHRWRDADAIAGESVRVSRRILRAVQRRHGIAFWALVRRIALDREAPVLPLLDEGPEVLAKLADYEALPAFFELLEAIAERHPRIAARMFQLGAELVQRFTIADIQRLAQVVEAMGEHSFQTALTLLQAAPELVERLPGKDTSAALMAIYALAAQAADHPQLAENLVRLAPQVIAPIGLEGLVHLGGRCIEIGRVSRPAALSLWESGCELIDRIGFAGLDRTVRLGRSIARYCPQTAAAFFARSGGIIDRLGPRGMWAFGVFCRRMAASGSGMAIRFPEQSPALIDRLLTRGDRRLIRTVYRLAGKAGRRHPMIAYQLLNQSPGLIDRIGVSGFEEFCILAQETARSSWTTADALIRVGTDVLDGLDFQGLRQMVHTALRIARRNVYGALNLLEKSPGIITRLTAIGGRPMAREVFALAAGAARSDWAVAVRLLENSPSMIEVGDYEAFVQAADRCTRMASQASASGTALVDAAAAILKSADIHTFLRVADVCFQLGPHSGSKTAGVIEAFPGHIEAWVAMDGPSLPNRVLNLIGEAARHNGPAALALLQRSDAYLAGVGFEGLQQIAAQTAALSAIDPEKAARFAAGEDVGFADFMANIPKGLQLDEIRPVIFNYLSALLGYRLDIVPGDEPAIGAGKIVLPAKIREFSDNERNFIYYKIMATRLEAHLEYGSFDLDVRRARTLIRSVQRRYGEAPVDDGQIDAFYRLFPEPALAEDLVHLFEKYRIDQHLKRAYPVLGEHIASVNRHDLKKRRSPEKIRNGKQRSVEALAQALLAERPTTSTAGSIHAIQTEALARTRAVRQSGAVFQDALEIAAELYFLIDDRFAEPYRPPESNRKTNDRQQIHQFIGNFGKTSRTIMERLTSQPPPRSAHTGAVETQGPASHDKPVPARRAPQQERVPHARRSTAGDPRQLPAAAATENRRPSPMASRQKDDTGSSSGMAFSSPAQIENLLRSAYKQNGITPNEIEKRIESLRSDQIGPFLEHMGAGGRTAEALEKEKRTALYSEWDGGRQRYRENWCRVRERTPPENSEAFYLQTLAAYGGLLKTIRREFQMMRPEELSKRNRLPDGEEIDLDAAVESVIDSKAGLSPSEDNYIKSEKKRRDIAVAILVDMSKSTKGETLRREKEALVIFSEALRAVGDAFAIYGFSGDNRDNVDFYRIKDFEDPCGRKLQRKISGIDVGLENRDGTALRHTIGLMNAREERTRLIILISDGKPVDKEYSGRYAIEDTRKALLEAHKAGIKTFCVTVDEKAADYLPRMYSHSSWTVIDDVARLPEKITRVFARLTQ